jgi:hypothetical protein
MIKKLFLLSLFSLIISTLFSQIKLPVNSDNKTQLSNWLVAKTSNLDEEKTIEIVENTKNYLQSISSNNIKELNLSNFNDIAIPFYQIFDSINFKNTLIAASLI